MNNIFICIVFIVLYSCFTGFYAQNMQAFEQYLQVLLNVINLGLEIIEVLANAFEQYLQVLLKVCTLPREIGKGITTWLCLFYYLVSEQAFLFALFSLFYILDLMNFMHETCRPFEQYLQVLHNVMHLFLKIIEGLAKVKEGYWLAMWWIFALMV